jgi:hypothetical protein
VAEEACSGEEEVGRGGLSAMRGERTAAWRGGEVRGDEREVAEDVA